MVTVFRAGWVTVSRWCLAPVELRRAMTVHVLHVITLYCKTMVAS